MVMYGDAGLELLNRGRRVRAALRLGPERRAFRVTRDSIMTSLRCYRIVNVKIGLTKTKERIIKGKTYLGFLKYETLINFCIFRLNLPPVFLVSRPVLGLVGIEGRVCGC
jgi:hypothetical protein